MAGGDLVGEGVGLGGGGDGVLGGARLLVAATAARVDSPPRADLPVPLLLRVMAATVSVQERINGLGKTLDLRHHLHTLPNEHVQIYYKYL